MNKLWPFYLQRNLIYTAVTRVWRLIVLVGTKKALALGIRNNRPRNATLPFGNG